jgi:hypothetical protein
MKAVIVAIAVLGAAGAIFYWKRSRPVERPGEPTAVMTQLRGRILNGSAKDFGITPKGEVWGVVMDMGYRDVTATVYGLADGNASLYLSSGGGVIGGIGHENVRAAAIKLCEVAEAFKGRATATKDFPLPAPDSVRFYLLTTSGARAAEATTDELAKGKHELSPLFSAAEDVLTQLRLVAQSQK